MKKLTRTQKRDIANAWMGSLLINVDNELEVLNSLDYMSEDDGNEIINLIHEQGRKLFKGLPDATPIGSLEEIIKFFANNI